MTVKDTNIFSAIPFSCSIERLKQFLDKYAPRQNILEVPTELKRPLLDITDPSESAVVSMGFKKIIILEVHILFKCGHCGTGMI